MEGKNNLLNYNSFSGEFYGLSFVLYVNFHESLKTINSYNGGLGAVIRIDNSSYLTSYIGSDGIKISKEHFWLNYKLVSLLYPLFSSKP